MNISRIRRLVKSGKFTIKPHSIPHRLKDGFNADDMVFTVMNGRIIEDYPDRSRCLIYAEIQMLKTATIPLHVVCDYSDPGWIDFVTGYIPDPEEWEHPPVKRKR